MIESRKKRIRRIRQKAFTDLCEWMEKSIKKEVRDIYKFSREVMGLRAADALSFARYVVQQNLNKFAEDNFYAGLPH